MLSSSVFFTTWVEGSLFAIVTFPQRTENWAKIRPEARPMTVDAEPKQKENHHLAWVRELMHGCSLHPGGPDTQQPHLSLESNSLAPRRSPRHKETPAIDSCPPPKAVWPCPRSGQDLPASARSAGKQDSGQLELLSLWPSHTLWLSPEHSSRCAPPWQVFWGEVSTWRLCSWKRLLPVKLWFRLGNDYSRLGCNEASPQFELFLLSLVVQTRATGCNRLLLRA